MIPKKLQIKLDRRKEDASLRTLVTPKNLIDFSSNDYLGFSANKRIFNNASSILEQRGLQFNGATGSRLLSGNHTLYLEAENSIANFHKAQSALIFNSGYDANLGFFAAVPQRGDLILYDAFCHASIRDGIQLSNAKAFKFLHNNLVDLETLIQRAQNGQDIYIVTESIFSMDGDQPDLIALVALCKKYGCYLIVDEAHAVGVVGDMGEGLVQHLGLEKAVFARIITFGKALGCHGAAILCEQPLQQFLINFARSFIYTTALPPHTIATLLAAYQELTLKPQSISTLHSNIAILHTAVLKNNLSQHFLPSTSAIHSCIVPGNNEVKHISNALIEEGYNVKAILSPTVPKGQERLRICIHSFNTRIEITNLLTTLATLIQPSAT